MVHIRGKHHTLHVSVQNGIDGEEYLEIRVDSNGPSLWLEKTQVERLIKAAQKYVESQGGEAP